ncbi:hypothetical protein RJ641_012889 [Dillenia turbinata]|uniref:Uncharacterized protein n=1 Tax=Dillenia turbinata TaxID=194707 RepID=A0AAN8Z2S3_9MAGN
MESQNPHAKEEKQTGDEGGKNDTAYPELGDETEKAALSKAEEKKLNTVKRNRGGKLFSKVKEYRTYELRFNKKHKEEVLNSYLPHVLEMFETIESNNSEGLEMQIFAVWLRKSSLIAAIAI